MISGVDWGWPQRNRPRVPSDARFVICEAGTGNYGDNFHIYTSYEHQVDIARRAGVEVGHYWFNGKDPASAARFFASHLHDFRKGQDVLALDNEDDPGLRAWTPSQALTFLETLQRETGQPSGGILIYMNYSVNHRFDWSPVVEAGYRLWYARPDGDPFDQRYWPSWHVRQTSVRGGVDRDEAVMSFAAMNGGAVPAHTGRPRPVSKRPKVAPRTPPPYPLPRGYYFGPEAGPVESVSGWHGHREDVRRLQQQLHDRGYALAVDGLYSPRDVASTRDCVTGRVVRAFQQDKRLVVDGLAGPVTWDAAWRDPVT